MGGGVGDELDGGQEVWVLEDSTLLEGLGGVLPLDALSGVFVFSSSIRGTWVSQLLAMVNGVDMGSHHSIVGQMLNNVEATVLSPILLALNFK